MSGETKKRILIVEDDEDMRQIYQDMFAKSQDAYQITFRENAQEALAHIDEHSYDLIILDIIMEPMSGDSFFVYLRKEKGIEKIPVLVVSVLGEEILGNLKEINHIDFLQKPITRQELFEKIEAMAG